MVIDILSVQNKEFNGMGIRMNSLFICKKKLTYFNLTIGIRITQVRNCNFLSFHIPTAT